MKIYLGRQNTNLLHISLSLSLSLSLTILLSLSFSLSLTLTHTLSHLLFSHPLVVLYVMLSVMIFCFFLAKQKSSKIKIKLEQRNIEEPRCIVPTVPYIIILCFRSYLEGNIHWLEGYMGLIHSICFNLLKSDASLRANLTINVGVAELVSSFCNFSLLHFIEICIT